MKGDELVDMGFPQGKIIGVILETLGQLQSSYTAEELVAILKSIQGQPSYFLDHVQWGPVAQALIEEDQYKASTPMALNEHPPSYSVFGQHQIEPGAIDQMNIAMKLPVTVTGALMPDAHQGYGLPIGGVLATRNAVIPYGVGVDIGCRMALSVYDIPFEHFQEHQHQYKRELIAWTKFGAGQAWEGKMKAEHPVLDKPEFKITSFIRGLQERAAAQLGTSGGGNHFVEFGVIEFPQDDAQLNMRKGQYLALLTHSGSRGFGATVAGHYTKLAKEICSLPKEAQNLAYLDLDSEAGQEYWIAMNLAGEYASACHEIIHTRLTKAIGGQVLLRVENHHNFAWKEQHDGQDVIVHRKGATPAAKDVLGIIPGSMTAPGFLVRGKGESTSIQSASHGAGRQMSRTQAIKTITRKEMQAILKDHGVTLIGAGLDEAPMAYKDIYSVMAAQQDLVDVVARFTPKLVRMADDGSRED